MENTERHHLIVRYGYQSVRPAIPEQIKMRDTITVLGKRYEYGPVFDAWKWPSGALMTFRDWAS